MKLRITRQNIPLLTTALVCVLLYAAASVRYEPGFLSLKVFINFFLDNAVLGIAAIGLTFVILSGGIDLSVGAVVGCTSVIIATLVMKWHVHPLWAILIVLALGTLFGAAMGSLIHFFAVAPFLVTLAGLFFCRGVSLLITRENIAIDHPFYVWVCEYSLRIPAIAFDIPWTDFAISIPAERVKVPALAFVALLIVAVYVSLRTRFGRTTYAIGGNEQSSLLMGLPVGTTRIGIYALSGFCSTLAGVVNTVYSNKGDSLAATGLELDAIAAVVVGGTLLTGGVGYAIGTLFGVLIFAMIQTAISFEGTLSPWWTKIVIGMLLLAFILAQKAIQGKKGAHT